MEYKRHLHIPPLACISYLYWAGQVIRVCWTSLRPRASIVDTYECESNRRIYVLSEDHTDFTIKEKPQRKPKLVLSAVWCLMSDVWCLMSAVCSLINVVCCTLVTILLIICSKLYNWPNRTKYSSILSRFNAA